MVLEWNPLRLWWQITIETGRISTSTRPKMKMTTSNIQDGDIRGSITGIATSSPTLRRLFTTFFRRPWLWNGYHSYRSNPHWFASHRDIASAYKIWNRGLITYASHHNLMYSSFWHNTHYARKKFKVQVQNERVNF